MGLLKPQKKDSGVIMIVGNTDGKLRKGDTEEIFGSDLDEDEQQDGIDALRVKDSNEDLT